MRTLALAAALTLGAAPGHAHETILQTSELEAAINDYTNTLEWQLLRRGPADATIARLWGMAVDTPIEDALVGSGTAQIRLVKIAAAGARVPSARIVVTDVAAMRERFSGRIMADVQIAKAAPQGAGRAMVVAQDGAYLELFEPGARPMTGQELKEFTAKGRFSIWTRFNNKLTGTVVWRPDGSAHVKWNQGTLDEEGTWTIRGDAVCTAWFRLREGKELCVQHYRLFGDTTQSFRLDGTPDGIHTWKPAGALE